MRTGWFIALATAFYLFVVAIFWPIERQVIQPRANTANGYEHGTVVFSDTSVRVSIPTTLALQELGLGGQSSLADGQGMYWIYTTADRPSFWMKGMVIPLDFIWIANNQVVDETTQVMPPSSPTDTNLPILQPQVPVNGVLEVPAGFINRHHISIGDSAVLDMQE